MRTRRTHHHRAPAPAITPVHGYGRRPAPPSVAQTMGHVPVVIPAGSVKQGPLEGGDQGVSPSETRHAEKVTRALMSAGGVQWVASYRRATGTYELVGRTGTLRFERWRTPTGEFIYRIVGIDGANPVPGTDGRAYATLEDEVAAAGGVGRPVADHLQQYPDLLRRIAQAFDDVNAPDLTYIPFPGADPNHPGAGSHGMPDVTQSRAPLVMAGPGIRRGATIDGQVRNVDLAPTIAQFLGVRPVVGRTSSGAARLQFLRWQDGNSFAGAISDAQAGAEPYGIAQRAIIFAIDGLNPNVLFDEMRKGHVPNLERIVRAGTTLRYGSLADFPAVTWSNHNAIASGSSPGNNGIINNSWYVRAERREQLITDGSALNSFRTGRLVDPKVETLYEAVRRSFGPETVTAAVNQPAGRGATISTLDLRGFGRLASNAFDIARRYIEGARTVPDQAHVRTAREYGMGSWQDNLASSLGASLLAKGTPPRFMMFEFTLADTEGHWYGPQSDQARAAVREADRNIGRVLDTLDERGLTPSTMITLTADHGMEHQSTDPAKLGGWFDALKRSGVATVESTRWVYLRTMRYSVHGSPPTVGSASRLSIRVIDDDTNTAGFRPAVAGATVTLTDAAGTVFTGTTDETGVAHVQVRPGASGALRLMVSKQGLTTEQGELEVGGDPAPPAPRGRRRMANPQSSHRPGLKRLHPERR